MKLNLRNYFVLASLISPVFVLANTATQSTVNTNVLQSSDVKQIESIVHNYLIKNHEILVEV